MAFSNEQIPFVYFVIPLQRLVRVIDGRGCRLSLFFISIMKVKIDWFTGIFIILSYVLVYFWGHSDAVHPRIIVYQPEYNHLVKMDTCRVVGDTAGTPLAIWYNDFIFMPDTAMMSNL